MQTASLEVSSQYLTVAISKHQNDGLQTTKDAVLQDFHDQPYTSATAALLPLKHFITGLGLQTSFISFLECVI